MSDAARSTAAFDYALPEGRIARYPAAVRDESRLLDLDRRTGVVRHRVFRELTSLFDPGDVLVLNDSRVRPARFIGHKPTGARAEVLLLRRLDDPDRAPRTERWEALVRPGGKLKPGRVMEVGDDLIIRIEDSTPTGERIVILESPRDVAEARTRHGVMPLPPYIERDAEPSDTERYQTVYAQKEGSVAAPTAGLHFTRGMLSEIESRGVSVVPVQLDVGVGTFRPVEVEDPAEHPMHREWIHVPERSADAIRRARGSGAHVWAVGTTVVRVLESRADEAGNPEAGSGWTELFIRPGYRFRTVDRLITNFHLPRSTLLMLVAAFGGFDRTMAAYAQAIAAGYRFYSYGDAMVVR